MKPNLFVRIVAPVIAISALPLVVGVASAWKVHTSQKRASNALAQDVAGIKSGESLAIGIRDIRTELNKFVDNPHDPQHLQIALRYREDMDHWFHAARGAAVTEQERDLIDRLGLGYVHFFKELEQISHSTLGAEEKARGVHELIDTIVNREMLKPAQDYLDANEEEINKSNADNQQTAKQVVLGLLLLGICGPASGLVAGFGIARGYSRSIVRLSLPIQDVAGELNKIVGPITLSSQAGLEETELALQKIAVHIGAVVKRFHESQREALRAEQLAAVGQMAAGIAHELRNPLMAMKILVQAASENSPAVLGGRDLMVLEEEITRLERSTETFLDFARPPEIERRTFDLRKLITQVVDLVSPRAERQGAHLYCDRGGDSPIPIQADMGQVRQVLLNLLLNALDAVPERGSISIEVDGNDNGAAPGWLTLRVSDTGPGLPGELGDRIFEPFVGTKSTGIGLGLSICKRIVESHGGRIDAADRPEGGATFTVRLPLVSNQSISAPQLAASK